MRPLRKEMATMSCWPWTVRMPVFFCWETSCRISGSLKRSRVPSTAMASSASAAQLAAETDTEVDRQTQDRHDPGQMVAGIIPPGDARSQPAEERQHQQGGGHEDGEERPSSLPDLGRGDAGEQDAPPAIEHPLREHLHRPLGIAEGAPRQMQRQGDQHEAQGEEHRESLAE